MLRLLAFYGLAWLYSLVPGRGRVFCVSYACVHDKRFEPCERIRMAIDGRRTPRNLQTVFLTSYYYGLAYRFINVREEDKPRRYPVGALIPQVFVA
jgi:hypothetical protein